MNSYTKDNILCAGFKDDCQRDSEGPLISADPVQVNRMTLDGVVNC